MSLWHTPQARTLMRTCPGPGFGISRSTISKSPPDLEICAAFIGATPTFVVAMMPPMNLKDNARKQLLPARRNLDCLTGSGSLKERRTKYLANSFLNTFDARPIKSGRRAITKLGENQEVGPSSRGCLCQLSLLPVRLAGNLFIARP